MRNNELARTTTPLPTVSSTPVLVGNTSKIDRSKRNLQIYQNNIIAQVVACAFLALSSAFLVAGCPITATLLFLATPFAVVGTGFYNYKLSGQVLI